MIQCSIIAQTLPYQVENNSDYPDDEVYVAIVGITDGHVWVDPVTGQVNPMRVSDNTVAGPIIDGNTGPGNNGLYANCFRKLSDIPGKIINIPKIAGCRIMISFQSQLYLYFFGHSGSPSGYAAPNLSNPTDPNQGIKYELIELTFNDFGLWCNTTRVDSYQYPMGLEVWGTDFYKRVGELKTHQEILTAWKTTAPSAYQGLLDANQGIIHFPTKTNTFPVNFFDDYIDAIWNKYRTEVLVFNSGQAGVWRGSVVGNEFIFTRDGDGQLAKIPGKPTTIEAMEGSGVLATGPQWDLVVQAQFVAAITRHAIDLNTSSGVLQDFGDIATYYQTWPYNWYSKFFHRSDISQDSQTYTFAYDDVFDQSATVHTSNPNRIKITIGGFAGSTPPNTQVVSLFQHCNFGGYQVALTEGRYTLSQLQNLGVVNNDISSIQVQDGYQIAMYDTDNFTGASVIKTTNVPCLVDDGFNDRVTSLIISKTNNPESIQIEAENYVIESGIQTEACSEGGLNVGWIDANDWLVWDVTIPRTGSYSVEYRVASPNTGGRLQFEKGGGIPVYGALDIPNTGDWQNWTTIQHVVNLESGEQQIAIKALTDGWNINWLRITKVESNVRLNPENSTVQDLIAYPVPASGVLNLKGLSSTSALGIYNAYGRLILKTDINGKRDIMVLDIRHLKSGAYVIKDFKTGKITRFTKQ
nr:beta-1,3-glucanase family protein [Aquimarina spongiae]